MKILFLTAIFILHPTLLLAVENNQNADNPSTFSLNAPGTLSGVKVKQSPDDINWPVLQRNSSPSDVAPKKIRYQYVDDQRETFRLPQFGQQNEINNPWSKQRIPRNLPERNKENPYTNPWHLGGPDIPGTDQYLSDSYRSSGSSQNYSGNNQFRSPAMLRNGPYGDNRYSSSIPMLDSTGFFPGTGGFMPGFGGNDMGGFPMPFDMFK